VHEIEDCFEYFLNGNHEALISDCEQVPPKDHAVFLSDVFNSFSTTKDEDRQRMLARSAQTPV